MASDLDRAARAPPRLSLAADLDLAGKLQEDFARRGRRTIGDAMRSPPAIISQASRSARQRSSRASSIRRQPRVKPRRFADRADGIHSAVRKHSIRRSGRVRRLFDYRGTVAGDPYLTAAPWWWSGIAPIRHHLSIVALRTASDDQLARLYEDPSGSPPSKPGYRADKKPRSRSLRGLTYPWLDVQG